MNLNMSICDRCGEAYEELYNDNGQFVCEFCLKEAQEHKENNNEEPIDMTYIF